MNTEGKTPWVVRSWKRPSAVKPVPHISMGRIRVGKTIELRESIGGFSLQGVRAESTREHQKPIPRPAWHVKPPAPEGRS
jgi:hypothetical protein